MGVVNERMKELRSHTDITLKQMADIIGVSEATVQRYESGKISKVPYEAIIAYSQKFNVSPGYLMGWDGNPHQKALNIFDMVDPKEGDEVRANQFKERFQMEYVTQNREITNEEYVIIQAYRDLDKQERDMIKRSVAYAEKFNELYGKEGDGK